MTSDCAPAPVTVHARRRQLLGEALHLAVAELGELRLRHRAQRQVTGVGDLRVERQHHVGGAASEARARADGRMGLVAGLYADPDQPVSSGARPLHEQRHQLAGDAPAGPGRRPGRPARSPHRRATAPTDRDPVADHVEQRGCVSAVRFGMLLDLSTRLIRVEIAGCHPTRGHARHDLGQSTLALVGRDVAELQHAVMLRQPPRQGLVGRVRVRSMTSPAADEQPDAAHPEAPPLADRRPVTTEHHGRTRTDEYDWLRAKGTPEVTAYLEAENAWTAAATDHLAGLRETIFGEIKSRTKETDLSVPTRNRGWWYYGRSFEGREYGRSCRVRVLDADDWTPPSPDEDAGPDQPALPGRADPPRPRRPRRGTRLLLRRRRHGQPGRDQARVLHRHRGRRALRPPGEGPRDRRPVARPDRGRSRRRRLESRRPRPLLLHRRRVLAPRQGLASSPRLGRTRRAGVPRDGRAVLGRHRPQPHPTLPGRSPAGRRTPPRAATSTARTRTPTGCSSTRGRRVCSTTSSTRSSPARTASWSCTTTPAPTSKWARPRSRPRLPPTGLPFIPYDEQRPARGRRGVLRASRGAPAQRRPDPAPHHRARGRRTG